MIERFAADLRQAIGPVNVFDAPDDLARYGMDGRGLTGEAALVARPGSAEEVSAIVRLAARDGIRLVPQGARTGLVGASIGGDDLTCIVSLERLNRPPRIDPVNRTATVDAGTLLSTLNEAAGRHGLFFPIDLGADPSIGGMVATNTGGARFLRYGDVRRNLLGLTVVRNDAQGTVVELGRELWKDNSGLDLKQIFVGGSGSLGIVTSAIVALQPKPHSTVVALLALPDAAAAIPLLATLEESFGTLVTAFEGLSAAAIDAALTHVPRLRNPFPGGTPTYAVLVELAAGRGIQATLLVDSLGEVLMPALADGRIVDVVIDEGPSLWALRHAVPEGIRSAGSVIGCDIALKRGDVMRFRADLTARLRTLEPRLVVHDFGHIGDGGLHFNPVWPRAHGPLAPELAKAARELVFGAVVREYGGSFSAEHGIGPTNAAFYERFVPAATRELAGAVQALAAPQPIGRVTF